MHSLCKHADKHAKRTHHSNDNKVLHGPVTTNVDAGDACMLSG
jgi:hypothetical protein